MRVVAKGGRLALGVPICSSSNPACRTYFSFPVVSSLTTNSLSEAPKCRKIPLLLLKSNFAFRAPGLYAKTFDPNVRR